MERLKRKRVFGVCSFSVDGVREGVESFMADCGGSGCLYIRWNME